MGCAKLVTFSGLLVVIVLWLKAHMCCVFLFYVARKINFLVCTTLSAVDLCPLCWDSLYEGGH